MALCISRYRGQKLFIGKNIVIRSESVERAIFVIDAPRHISIARPEILADDYNLDNLGEVTDADRVSIVVKLGEEQHSGKFNRQKYDEEAAWVKGNRS